MKALYAGSFDPITNGHLDIIKQAANIFDTVAIVVASNPKKATTGMFSLEKRQQLIIETCLAAGLDKNTTRGKSHSVWICPGRLIVDFAYQIEANVLIRGLRAVSDFDIEFQMVQFNRKIKPGINTVFFMPDERYFYLSSSAVREIFNMGGDVSEFVPRCVNEAMLKLRSTCWCKEQKL